MDHQPLNLTNLTILVADPNQFYRQIVHSILHSFGTGAVLEAGTAAETLQILKSKKVDVLFSEAELPDKSGFALVRDIRMDKSLSFRSIPILIMMGATRRVHVSKARDAGAHIVIKKPVSPLAIYDRLAWIANTPRAYWESDDYYGPDRRVRVSKRADEDERRKSDVSQKEIDHIFAMETADEKLEQQAS